ncbi:MAG: hypothetical protein QS748_11290 [Candidatus Endonucleobacter bathymodioli]|uniref:Uncharacterized protein n=1 Tax=Candidatus Endonucleibacter bathymodioli TaxID=539814 RepID=A0AA90NUQ9_9GAMM|nr:hypothetical protein [Candidatus Endonucleobacter bathymodioli]
MEQSYVARLTCKDHLYYNCLQDAQGRRNKQDGTIYIETCKKTFWITQGHRGVFSSLQLNFDYAKCPDPFISPELTFSTDPVNCRIREDTCDSEGQVDRNDSLPHDGITYRQLCACSDGYSPVNPTYMKVKNITLHGQIDDASCYWSSEKHKPPFIISTTPSDVTLTADEIMRYIHTESTMYYNLHTLFTESRLPPIILIAGGIPFLIVIPLCLLRYAVNPDDDDPDSMATDENQTTIVAIYTDNLYKTTSFTCTVRESNTPGRLELQGTITADNNTNPKTLVQNIFSNLGVGRGVRRGNNRENISVVSERLLAIQPAEGAEGAEGQYSCDYTPDDPKKTRIRKPVDENAAKKKHRTKSKTSIRCCNRRNSEHDPTECQPETEKTICDIEETIPTKPFTTQNTANLIKKYEQMHKFSLVDGNRNTEKPQACGGTTPKIASSKTKKKQRTDKMQKTDEVQKVKNVSDLVQMHKQMKELSVVDGNVNTEKPQECGGAIPKIDNGKTKKKQKIDKAEKTDEVQKVKNASDLVKIYEQIQELSLVDGDRNKENPQACGGAKPKIDSGKTKKKQKIDKVGKTDDMQKVKNVSNLVQMHEQMK